MFLNRRIATSGGGDKFRDEFSVAFDGSNDYLDSTFIPDYISTNATTAFWIKMNDFSGTQQIGIHNNKRWYHGFDGSALFIGVANAHNSSSPVTPSPALAAGEWIHYCVTAIGGTATMYINGVAQGTLSYTQSSATDPDTGYMMGARDNSGAGNYMNGNISEVVHYNVGLTASQVKTIYNGREPYNYKEGVASNYLKAWWRMGDNSLDKYPLMTDSTNLTVGSNILTNPSFDSNITGWDDYSSGTVSHETSIAHLGSGSLKTTFDGTNDWAFKTTDNFTLETNSIYLIEAYCYIPSSNGASNLEPFITTGGTFGGYSHTFSKGDSSLTNQWQYIFNVTKTGASDTSGKLYGNALNNPDSGDILYWDNITLRKINGSPALFHNMSAADIEGDAP